MRMRHILAYVLLAVQYFSTLSHTGQLFTYLLTYLLIYLLTYLLHGAESF